MFHKQVLFQPLAPDAPSIIKSSPLRCSDLMNRDLQLHVQPWPLSALTFNLSPLLFSSLATLTHGPRPLTPQNLASHGFPNTFLQSGAPLSHQFDPSPQIPCSSAHTHGPPSNFNPAPSGPRSLKPHVPQFWDPQRAGPPGQRLPDLKYAGPGPGPPRPSGCGCPKPRVPQTAPRLPEPVPPAQVSRPGTPRHPACGYFRPQTPRPPGTWVPQARGPTDPRRAGPSGLGPLLPHPPRLAHLPRGLTRAGQCG